MLCLLGSQGQRVLPANASALSAGVADNVLDISEIIRSEEREPHPQPRTYCVLCPCPAHLPCVCEGFLCAESLSSTIIITLILSYFSLEEAVCFPACFRPKYAQFIFIEG